ncbi:sialin, putative [Pediculus humanus corporis]|uniref:Sialin, putative n=1 Tax=Pediculus humanus subsp. corporis TaxID=121224 RepID=E0VV51_PEDHC|nr:sialin, putative [Pediculus humanus corporis]EEB17257.1 sialin, putative [Pediculus humanus corporis]
MDNQNTDMRQDGLGHPCCIFRRRRYYIAIMACIGYVVSYSTRVNLSVAIIFITKESNATTTKKEFMWDENVQGIILASFFYGYIITQIPGGYLAGIIGGNHVLNLGVAGSGLISFVGPACLKFSVGASIAMRVICGLFQGVTVPAISSMWARWAPPLERTILSTIAISGNFFSSIIIMPICSVIGDYLGWEWMFYIFGALSLAWSVAWSFTVFAGPEKDIFIKESELQYIQTSIGERTDSQPKHPWKRIFSSMPVGAAVVAQTGHNWGYYTMLLHGPKYYHETLKINLQLSSFYTGLCFTVTGFLMQVFGQISDFLRRTKHMKTVSVRKMFCCGGFLAQSIFMILLIFNRNPYFCVAFSILAIGMGGITWSAFNVNPLDIAAPHAAIISGLANTCATLSGIFAPMVSAWYISGRNSVHIEDWMGVWIICVIIYFLSAIFFLLFAAGEKQSWVYTANEN